MSNIRNGYINLDNGRIYYEAAGEGEPLVFMHAGFVDSRMWDDQWEEFCREYFVIRYDMRGFGKSDQLVEPVSRREELYLVLDHLGIGCATLIGCSLGGETILDVALESPELVSSLIVVSATPSGFEFHGEPPQLLLETMAAVEQGNHDKASELQTRLLIDGPFRQSEHVNQQVRKRALEMNRNALVKGTYAFTFAEPPDPLEPPAISRLDQIKAPTLIIAGELDNPEILRAAGVMADSIPDSRKVIIPGCGHFPNMEQPSEFNQTVKDFVYLAEKVSC